jgi:hypothetical protein
VVRLAEYRQRDASIKPNNCLRRTRQRWPCRNVGQPPNPGPERSRPARGVSRPTRWVNRDLPRARRVSYGARDDARGPLLLTTGTASRHPLTKPRQTDITTLTRRAGHNRPRPGRDPPEWVVAISRNKWSPSSGTGGRDRRNAQPMRRVVWSSGSNGITRQSTAGGSIWRSRNSASYRPNASIAASPRNKCSSRKLRA